MDDELVLQKTVNVPQRPRGMVLNLWGDGGNWSGEMKVGDEVVLGVHWVQVVFNISGNTDGRPGVVAEEKEGTNLNDARIGKGGSGGLEKRREKADHQEEKCKVACHVNGVKQIGFPELTFNTTTTKSAAATNTLVSFGADGQLVVVLLAVLAIVCAAVWILSFSCNLGRRYPNPASS